VVGTRRSSRGGRAMSKTKTEQVKRQAKDLVATAVVIG